VDASPESLAAPVRERSAQELSELRRAGEAAARVALVRGTMHFALLTRADGTIIWSSPSTRRLLGYEPDEIVGRTVLQIVHPEERDFVRRVLAHAAENPLDGSLDLDDANLVIDLQLLHKEGHTVDLGLLRNNLLATEGVHAILVMARESAGRRALDRVLTSLAHEPTAPHVLAQLVGFVDDRFTGLSAALYTPGLEPSWVTRHVPGSLRHPGGPWEAVVAEGRPVVVGDFDDAVDRGLMAPQLAEAARAEGFVGCWAFPVPPGAQLADSWLPPLPHPGVMDPAGRRGEIDALVVWSTGHREPLIGHLGTVERMAGLAYLALSRRREEIRQRRRLAFEQEQNRRLVEIDDLRTKLIFDLSHELRTPVTSIIGFAELARDLPRGQESAELDEYLEIIARNADRLRRLTGDLLLIGRLASHTLEIVVDSVDVSGLVQGAVAALQPQAVDKGVELRCSGEPGTPLEGDAGRLGQLIDNLVSNAIKYTDQGGTVSVTATPDDGAWRIAVRDTGMGIPKDEQPRLFEQFFRASNARARAIAGSGLGLAIAGGIARLHGGHIEVVSEVGEGSTFTVVLRGAEGPPEP
jgi:signal transduction histidine kinase